MEILTGMYIPLVCFMVAPAILKDNKTVVDKEIDKNELLISVITNTKKLTEGKIKCVAKKTN